MPATAHSPPSPYEFVWIEPRKVGWVPTSMYPCLNSSTRSTFVLFTIFILHYIKKKTTTMTTNILLFFTFIWILGNYCLFPWRNILQTKKKSSTTLKSANPRSQQLEDNPQGQGRTQVSSETRQAHIKTASWGDDCFNATDPGSGYPFSLVAPTATTSNR